MDQFAFETELRNGTRVLIRPVLPEDKHLLEVGFDHLSDRSRYFRFLGLKPTLTEPDLDYFTNTHGDDHVAIGALDMAAHPAQPVGIARYVRLPDRPEAAEIAITVVDTHQGLGLGSLMIGALALHAVDHGVSCFVALVHEDNEKMLHVFRELGAQMESHDGHEEELTIPLHSDPANYPDTPTGDAMREAVRLAQKAGPKDQS